LHQDLIAELRPDGPLQNETVADIARLTWRKQNLETFRIAEAARARYSAIISKIVPEDRFPVLDFGLPSADPEELETRRETARAEGRRELGDGYIFAEMGKAVTISRMFEDFEVEERLGAMIDRLLKRLLFLKGLKSLPSAASSAPLPRIPKPQKAA
jgi:hypothetical protein